MNKIYKVVWNKARNCYVVASEFAKNHQTGSSRIKAASVAAVMAATMLTIGTGVIYAAKVDVEDRVVKGIVEKQTILFDNTKNETTKLNDPNLKHDNPYYEGNGHTDKCGELTYNTTLTIGDINQVVDKLVDNDTLLYNQGIQKVTMNNGTISLIRNDNTSVTNSIALTGKGGKDGKDTAVTVTVGNESQTFKTGSVVVANLDDSGKATGLTINEQSYDIKAGKTYKAGENVTIADDGTISAKDTTYSAGDHVNIDDKHKISVDLSEYAKSDDVAVVYQDNDKNKSLHSTNAGTVDSSSIALGKEATTGKWSVALGDQTKATGEHSTAIGAQAEATKNGSIAIGQQTKAQGENSVAIGQQTKAQGENSVAIGAQIQFTGYLATAVGQQAHATGDYSTALGSMTNVDAVWNGQHPGEWRKSGTQSTAIGHGSGSWGDYSTALGAFAKTENQFSSAIGYNSQATAENAVALGGAATANVYGGVALGTSSVADRAAEAGVVGAFAPEGADGLTWKANAGAVSVGSNTITRQITNVAAGSEATDAVNVAQLRAATANANKGWNLSTNGVTTAATNVKPGDNVDFSGDKNVSVSKDAKDGVKTVKIELNKDLVGIETISNDGASLTLNSTATELTNGKGAAITLFGDTATINNKVTVYNNGRISGVAAGIRDTDAVNVSQLKNSAWKLAANGVLTEAEDVKAGDYVDFNGDQNVSVSKDAKDGVKTVKVELNKDLKDIESISNDGASLTLNGTATELTNGKGAAITLFGDTTTINNKVTVYKDGRIAGVAAGINDKDAVNVGQLNAVGVTANKGWNLATNGVATKATNVKPGDYVDFSGDKNISVSHDGTKVQVELNKNIDVNYVQTNALNSKYNLSVGTMAENGIMPFLVNSTGAFYAANNNFSVDKGGKVIATAGEIGNVVLQNGVYTGNSALRDGELYVGDADGNYSQITTKGAKLGKVTVAEDGKISGVAAGAVTADSTDAVNGSQLHAVATEAGKHSKVVNGSNINVEEFDNDGQKIYKVNLNKDILLGDITGKNVSISGTNGTIETTGYIATKDRIIADKGAKLADVDITGDTISNDKSSVKLDKEGTVTINNKVTIDGNGKVSGVADGEISDTSTDAVNGSQLKKTNDRVTNVENDVKNIQGDITNIKGDITNIKGDITTIKGDVTNLDNRVTKVEQTAGKHSSVSTEDTNIQITEGTNTAGGIDYKLSLNKDQNLNSVTTGNTKMDTNGITVGDKVSLTKDGLMAGETKVTNDGLSIGGKTYVSKDGLNANNQTITNVADGKVEKGSTDAVNGGQLYETNQAIANNATNISSLSHSISNLDNRVNKVGAGAAALAALHPLDFDPDAKWDFAAGYGNYRGANAAAVGAYYRPNEDTMFSVGGTFGNGENMVNAGVSFKLGSGSSHVSTSRVAMAKEIKELRGELEAMKSAMLDANAGKKIDTSKLQLFPDVPQNHWAYEYVAQLAGNGMIEGYPDGNFAGDRPMTRYEFAAILYRAMTKGAVLSDKLLSEFSHELEYFTVDTIAKDKAGNPTIQRVRTVKENKNK